MLRFFLRRIMLAVPTLFGITLITFALIHLAPGDPLAGSSEGFIGAGSSRESEQLRRLYFLDLPLFFNPRPRGVQQRVEHLLAELQQPGARGERGATLLRRCGTACLPALAESLQQQQQQQQQVLPAWLAQRILGILDDLRAQHPGLDAVPAEKGTAAVRTKVTHGSTVDEQWLSRARVLLAPRSVAPLAERLGQQDGIKDQLVARGSAVLPAVMEILLHREGAARQAASEVASALSGMELTVSVGDPHAKTIVDQWSEWWFQHRRDYQRFSGWQRFWGHMTETQYGKWLGRLLTLRFGYSTHDSQPVLAKLALALPITMLLSLISMFLAYLVAVPLGVQAAVHQGAWGERLTTFLLFVLYSLPSFWVAMLLILFLGGLGYLDWFPIYGLSSTGMEQASGWTWIMDRLHHLVLPVLCLTYGSLAVLSRYQRSAMLEVIRQDYIRTARAKGLSQRAVVYKHALRNALLPMITLLGLQLPYLISGSVIIERIFNIPGMGLLTWQAFLERDYPVIMAVSVLSAALTLLGLMLADLFYAMADPRISLEEQR